MEYISKIDVNAILMSELKNVYASLRYSEDYLKYEQKFSFYSDYLIERRNSVKRMISIMISYGALSSDVELREMLNDFSYISGADMKPIFPISTDYRVIGFDDCLTESYSVCLTEVCLPFLEANAGTDSCIVEESFVDDDVDSDFIEEIVVVSQDCMYGNYYSFSYGLDECIFSIDGFVSPCVALAGSDFACLDLSLQKLT